MGRKHPETIPASSFHQFTFSCWLFAFFLSSRVPSSRRWLQRTRCQQKYLTSVRRSGNSVSWVKFSSNRHLYTEANKAKIHIWSSKLMSESGQKFPMFAGKMWPEPPLDVDKSGDYFARNCIITPVTVLQNYHLTFSLLPPASPWLSQTNKQHKTLFFSCYKCLCLKCLLRLILMSTTIFLTGYLPAHK